MRLTRIKIEEFKDEIDGLSEYLLIVNEIEDNIPEKPDISIESCKSLIEGLCKKSLELISEEYQENKNLRKNCDNKMLVLVETAFNEVYKDSFEKNLHFSLYNIIGSKVRLESVLNSSAKKMKDSSRDAVKNIMLIRDKRGDISHGRIYPKESESELHLANSVLSITDGICSFMIHELAIQYQIKQEQAKKLIYKEEENYNEWLDEKNDNLLTKIDFSRLLFDNNYEKYEEIYYSEYQEYLETLITEDQDDSADTSPVEKVDRQIESLINTFQEQEFWTEARSNALNQFAYNNNLNADVTRNVIEEFLFTEKLPLPDEVIETLNVKPSLKERRPVIEKATSQLVNFSRELQEIKE